LSDKKEQHNIDAKELPEVNFRGVQK